MDDLVDRLAWARQVAQEVGVLLLARRHQGVTGQRKDRGIVTDLDHQAEDLIARSLGERFPQDGLEAEEGTSRPALGAWRWVVDPLDGTTNYVCGLPMFTVSLACLDDQGPALGLVHAPALGETFEAVRTAAPTPGGTTAAGARAGGAEALKDAVFIVNKAYAPAATLWGLAGGLMAGIRAFRTLGCVSLDLALVAAGRADGLVLLPADPWDVAAGLLLVSQAGMAAVSLDGSPNPDGRGGILATSPHLLGPALELLRGAAPS